MASRTANDPNAAQMPDIGDVYAHRGGSGVRQWRVAGLMVHGARSYAVLCDITDPAKSAIVAVADLGIGGPFERVLRQ